MTSFYRYRFAESPKGQLFILLQLFRNTFCNIKDIPCSHKYAKAPDPWPIKQHIIVYLIAWTAVSFSCQRDAIGLPGSNVVYPTEFEVVIAMDGENSRVESKFVGVRRCNDEPERLRLA